MSAHHPLRGPQPHTAQRQATAHLRRLAAALVALTSAVLVSAAVVPAAWATIPSGGGSSGPTVQAHAVRLGTASGMTGWQITLIALCTAIVAATAAVLLDRARAARHTTSATARHASSVTSRS